MSHKIQFYYSFIFLQYVAGVISTCPRETYLNLCSANEKNTTLDSSLCNCEQFIFCSILEFPLNCTTIVANLQPNLSTSDLNEVSCSLESLESDILEENSTLEILNISTSHIEISINNSFEGKDEGKFKLTCKQLETEINNEKLEILDIFPKTAEIDSELELQISLSSISNSTNVWCCVRSDDNESQILPAVWVQDDGVICSKFVPDVPGCIYITLNCYKSRSNVVVLKIQEKPVIAEKAEYSHDFLSILLYFNQNIELHSDCSSVFSQKSRENFGIGFMCELKGNLMSVVLGSNFKKADILEIVAGNSIYTAGCKDVNFCSMAVPALLHISEKKVLGPNLSLNSDCDSGSKHKHMSIMAVPLETHHPDDSGKTYKAKTIGKNQRENLIVWRIIRHLQTKLSSSLIDVHINSTDVHPSLEHLVSLESFMENEKHLSPSSESVVSVVVMSPPAPSVISAEARVSFCGGDNNNTLFNYKWSVNEEVVQEGGKILRIMGLPPGKYVVTCAIIQHNTTKILGQVSTENTFRLGVQEVGFKTRTVNLPRELCLEGWTTAEVTEAPDKILIYPSEIEAGREDNITLYTQTWYSKSISWTCETELGNSCYTAAQLLIKDVVNLSSLTIFIPAGTLPVGSYFWTATNGADSTTAKVIIKSNNIPSITFENPKISISSSQMVVVNGIVKDLEMGCRVWYTSVREKGFDYLDLKKLNVSREVEISTELSEEIEIPLTLSPGSRVLKPSSSYMFRLQALCPASGLFSQMKIPVFVNDPPKLSPLIIQPLRGEAMITEFTVSGAEANDLLEDHPLFFKWSIMDPCENEIQIETGLLPKVFSTFLPPGDIMIKVEVCDVKNACSVAKSSVVSVVQPTEIPSENFKKLFTQMEFLMASDETTKAFTLAEIALKSIALTAEGEIREELLTILQKGITTKIYDLTEKLKSDPQTRDKALEFIERGSAFDRFFPKESDIFKLLEEFKEFILKTPISTRIKRNSVFSRNKVSSIFKFHSTVMEKNDTIENRMELLKDVRKYMLEVCSESLLNSFLIVSPIVNISMMKVDIEDEGNHSIEYHVNDSFKVEIVGKIFKRKTCIGVAEFFKDFLGNTNESRLTPVYDIQLIKDGKFTKSLKDNSNYLVLSFQSPDSPKTGIDCMTWTKNRGWAARCEFKESNKHGIVCVCKEFGYFSAFRRFPKDSGRYKDKNKQKLNYWDSCVAFTVNGEFEKVIGKNSEEFVESLKQQIVQQMKIPNKSIYKLTVKPGSIVVTVFFIDVNETKAERVVKDLVTRIYTRDLHLTDSNSTRLDVDTNTMEILLSPRGAFNSSGIRFATYTVLIGSLVVTFVTGLGILVVKKKKPQSSLTVREVSENKHSVYSRFYNEYSLNGSSDSLATYRRNSVDLSK